MKKQTLYILTNKEIAYEEKNMKKHAEEKNRRLRQQPPVKQYIYKYTY